MDANLLNLLVQIPIVGIFVWFAIEMSKRAEKIQANFLAALDKRDEAFDQRNRAICTQLDGLTQFVKNHDEREREAHANIKIIKAKLDRDTSLGRRKPNPKQHAI